MSNKSDDAIVSWNSPTAILYGSEDNLCEFDMVSAFIKRFNCDLQVMEHGEHYFHTEEQLEFFRQWLGNRINKRTIYMKTAERDSI